MGCKWVGVEYTRMYCVCVCVCVFTTYMTVNMVNSPHRQHIIKSKRVKPKRNNPKSQTRTPSNLVQVDESLLL